jgi:D-alanyl-D-alanine carboxypeptidase
MQSNYLNSPYEEGYRRVRYIAGDFKNVKFTRNQTSFRNTLETIVQPYSDAKPKRRKTNSYNNLFSWVGSFAFFSFSLALAYYVVFINPKPGTRPQVAGLLSYKKYTQTPNVVVPTAEAKYENTLKNIAQLDSNWKPTEKLGIENQPLINGKAGLMIDLEENKILYEKDSEVRLPIASVIKIMTAVLALEHKELNYEIKISKEAASIGENSMGITEGETYRLEELLYGLVLNSGNDAAYAIAEGVAGDKYTFIKWMNIKAKELGLRDSNFLDPSGLNDDSYSTALDLVKLTRYAMKNPDFRRIVATREIELKSPTHKDLILSNQTNLVGSYPGVAGVKTGYTEEAGLCLVTYANNGGKEVIGVVLGSADRRGDMILMLDHAYQTLKVKIEHAL